MLPGQLTMDGCEPDQAGMLQRKADAPLKPAAPQEPCDIGLWSDARLQAELDLMHLEAWHVGVLPVKEEKL